MTKLRAGIVSAALLLAACASGTEVETVGGGKAYLSDPVAVDIVEARFNVPFLLPQIDGVRQTLRDNGTVVQETYYSGDARVAVVEHVFDAWFNNISIESARDAEAFFVFLGRTPMRAGSPVVREASGPGIIGFVAQDGPCVAFRFLKRIKGSTGYDNDREDPDTFVAGYSCDADGQRFVDLFDFMSPEDKARVDRRNSI
ncbi:MAG: hypothetical protein JJ899_07415 [Alphaproteobacteria bacterium]|nr:hypothetical protein [Alphaproteobacteria bacterium]